MIFSAIQGIAEIFKIHGSVEEPDSIVINEQDYLDFDRKSAYLAAKVMTIFMEYPIIFMGYSISDVNIQKIIKSIIECLDMQQIKLLEDRFVFVEYQSEKVGIEVSPYTIMVGDKPLSMKRVIVEDIEFSADDLLQHAFNDLVKQNSGRLPINKYLSEASGEYPECMEFAQKQSFDTIISTTIKRHRHKLGEYKSVKQIWENEKNH